MHIILANPCGFCAGVNRAISIVERVLGIYGAPIYVYHEIVHNRYVLDKLSKQGVVFIEQISEVPYGAILIFSAHGVSQKVRIEADSRDLIIFDATCPLVTKIHMKVARASRKGMEVILIGHAGHPEVAGTMGQYNNCHGGIYLVASPEAVWHLNVKNVDHLCFMTQTTLSVYDTSHVIEVLRARFPAIIGPRKNDICYATTNRQNAVQKIVTNVDMVLVIGAQNSSNSNRLAELAQRAGKPTYLIDSANNIHSSWLRGIRTVGVTAGASTPDILVHQVIEYLLFLGAEYVEGLLRNEENIVFEMPKILSMYREDGVTSLLQSDFMERACPE